MMNNKKRLIFISIPLVLILLYGLTYIPHKVINIQPSQVSKIAIFDGSTGYQVEITDKKVIQSIIHNLNEVTFQKERWAMLSMGISFRTTIYNQKGQPIKKLIINAPDTIRYQGFFYRAKGSQTIDYEYIHKLVEQLRKQP